MTDTVSRAWTADYVPATTGYGDPNAPDEDRIVVTTDGPRRADIAGRTLAYQRVAEVDPYALPQFGAAKDGDEGLAMDAARRYVAAVAAGGRLEDWPGDVTYRVRSGEQVDDLATGLRVDPIDIETVYESVLDDWPGAAGTVSDAVSAQQEDVVAATVEAALRGAEITNPFQLLEGINDASDVAADPQELRRAVNHAETRLVERVKDDVRAAMAYDPGDVRKKATEYAEYITEDLRGKPLDEAAEDFVLAVEDAYGVNPSSRDTFRQRVMIGIAPPVQEDASPEPAEVEPLRSAVEAHLWEEAKSDLDLADLLIEGDSSRGEQLRQDILQGLMDRGYSEDAARTAFNDVGSTVAREPL